MSDDDQLTDGPEKFDLKDCRKLACHFYQKGFTYTETSIRICQQQKYKLDPASPVAEWYNEARS